MTPSFPVANTPWRRAGGHALDLAGFAALIALVFINLGRFDWNWDAVEYHLPFAALRAGLMKHSAFVMRDTLEARYRGFPPVGDFVQGVLWRLTGRPEATQLVSPIAMAAFAAYARWAFGMRAFWTVAIIAAIPITLTALNSASLDVWTNAFFCIYLLAAFKALRAPAPGLTHTLIAAAALGLCVNSKMQFFVMGAAALAIQAAAALFLIWRDWRPAARRTRRRALVVTVVLAPMMFFSPIYNVIRFGNPVYPIVVKIGGLSLPGNQTNVWVGPRRLEHVSPPERYVLSQLDFDAINARFQGFDQDQGGQPEGSDGNRMGGALSVLLIGSVGALALALRRRRWTMPDWVALAAAGCLLAVVVAFPGSNELRYFCFINIMASFAALAVVGAGASGGDAYASGLLAGLRLLVVGGVMFTNFATGLRQVGFTDMRTLQEITAKNGTDELLAAALRNGDTVCYLRQDSDAMFFSPLLDPYGRGHHYRIVIKFKQDDCPIGSFIVR